MEFDVFSPPLRLRPRPSLSPPGGGGNCGAGWRVSSNMPGIPHIRIMYGVHGQVDLEKRILPHLEGYRDRRRFESVTAPLASTSSTSMARCWLPSPTNQFRPGLRQSCARCLVLPIPAMGLLPATDPRIKGTIEAVMARLMPKEGLLYRYEGDDGLPGGEGCFALCSFWLIKVLCLADRRRREAEEILTALHRYFGPLAFWPRRSIRTATDFSVISPRPSAIQGWSTVPTTSEAATAVNSGPVPAGLGFPQMG